MKNPLKTVSPEDIKKAEQNKGTSGSKLFLLLKDGYTQYDFTEGTHNLRLVPQPNNAKETWSGLIPYCYLNKSITPSCYGYFAFTEDQVKKNREVQSYLYNSDWASRMKRAKQNPTGIDLGIKYRAIFYGFNYSDPDPKMLPILLPANAPKATQGRIQVGTRIKQFMYEKDIHGKYKHGDLVNLDSGKIVQITVTGSGDRREYIPSVDAVAPLIDDNGYVLPRYQSLITQVNAFEDIIAYHSDEVFEQMIMAKLHDVMKDDIKQRFFSSTIISTPSETVTTKKVELPTPEEIVTNEAPATEVTQEIVSEAVEPTVEADPDEIDISKIDWTKVTPAMMSDPKFQAALQKASQAK